MGGDNSVFLIPIFLQKKKKERERERDTLITVSEWDQIVRVHVIGDFPILDGGSTWV